MRIGSPSHKILAVKISWLLAQALLISNKNIGSTFADAAKIQVLQLGMKKRVLGESRQAFLKDAPNGSPVILQTDLLIARLISRNYDGKDGGRGFAYWRCLKHRDCEENEWKIIQGHWSLLPGILACFSIQT